jgi:hypothetical protein
MACVYALVSSGEPDIVRYVGRTKYDTPNKRLASHRGHIDGGLKTHVYNWMRSVYNSGEDVVALILESSLSWEESGERERHFIKSYRDQGYDLTNISLGGDGHAAISQETRDLMSRNRKGKSPSPQAHAAAKLANIGRAKTKEEKAKVSAANKGRVKTPEVCKRLSEIAKARPRKPHTQETKNKISATKQRNFMLAKTRIEDNQTKNI